MEDGGRNLRGLLESPWGSFFQETLPLALNSFLAPSADGSNGGDYASYGNLSLSDSNSSFGVNPFGNTAGQLPLPILTDDTSPSLLNWSKPSRILILGYAVLALVTSAGAALVHICETRISKSRGYLDEISLPSGPVGGPPTICEVKYYRNNWLGRCMLLLYWLAGVFRFFLLLAYVLAKYEPKSWDFLGVNKVRLVCDPDDPNDCIYDEWDSLLGPYIALFILTRLREVVAKCMPDMNQTLFMWTCEPRDAELVLVKVEDRWRPCPIVREGNRRMFTVLFYLMMLDEDDKFVCHHPELLTKETVDSRLKQGGLTNDQVQNLYRLHGRNALKVDVPSPKDCLVEEFDSWFYLYQFSCIWWFFFQGSTYISTTWTVLTILSGSFRALHVTRKARLRTFEMTKANTALGASVHRGGSLTWVLSADIVPGDLVVVEQGSVLPCDCLLIEGSALVDESMLTGESVPSWRVASEIAVEILDAQDGGSSQLLLGGSRVLESESGEAGKKTRDKQMVGTGTEAGMLQQLTEDGVGQVRGDDSMADWSSEVQVLGRALAVARWTGGLSVQASLVRDWQTLPPEGQLQHFEQVKSWVVALFGLVFVELAVMCYVYFDSMHHAQTMDMMALLQRCINMFLPLVNPMVGVVTCFTNILAVRSLSEKGISCLLAPRIAMAGRLDTMVLDKTGTITESTMSLLGVDLCEQGTMGHLYPKEALHTLPEATLCCLSACSELNFDKGERDVAFGKRKSIAPSMKVLRVMNFSRASMTSGCVCQLPNGDFWAFIKGAAANVQACDLHAPKDFSRAADRWGGKCLYVLGCAARRLAEQEVEAPWEDLVQGMRTIGLLLFMNQVKPDSQQALEQIRSAGIRCIMCTGDSLHSGVSVARLVGLIPENMPVYRVRADGLAISTTLISKPGRSSVRHGEVGFASLVEMRDDEEENPCSGNNEEDEFDEEARELEALGILEEGVFGIEQEDWAALLESPSLPFVLDRLVVFGRMPPDGKISVVRAYQELGQVVGMCGDGSNDCGAMCAANVGLAVGSGAGAALIAPFHTLNPRRFTEATVEAEVERMRERSLKAKRADIKASADTAVARLTTLNRSGSSACSSSVTRSATELPVSVAPFPVQRTSQFGANAFANLRASQVGGSNPLFAKRKKGYYSKSLLSLVDLLITGRSVMATHAACLGYFAMWTLCLTQTEILVFCLNGCSLGSGVWFINDVILSVLIPIAMATSAPADELASRKPTGLLMGPRVRRGVGLSMVTYCTLQCTAMLLLRYAAGDTFVAWDNERLGISGHLMNRLGDNFDSEVLSIVVMAHISACSLAGCLASRHRQPLRKNWLLLTVTFVVWCCFTVVIFSTGTILNAWSRINCDSQTLYDLMGLCFIGPQLIFWHPAGATSRESWDTLQFLVQQYRPQNGCIDLELMKANGITGKYTELKNINNILPMWYCAVLFSLCVLEAAAFVWLYDRIVMTDHIDHLEEELHAKYMKEAASQRWSTLGHQVTDFLGKDNRMTTADTRYGSRFKSINFDIEGSAGGSEDSQSMLAASHLDASSSSSLQRDCGQDSAAATNNARSDSSSADLSVAPRISRAISTTSASASAAKAVLWANRSSTGLNWPFLSPGDGDDDDGDGDGDNDVGGGTGADGTGQGAGGAEQGDGNAGPAEGVSNPMPAECGPRRTSNAASGDLEMRTFSKEAVSPEA